MNEEEPLVYYVKCINHPNLAIQANSHDEYKDILEDFMKDTKISIADVEILTPSEYKRKYR